MVGGLASIGGMVFGALFIEFVPNYADELSVHFGESAKALPGAIYGLLLILIIWIAPSGVAGLARSLARWAAGSRLSFVASTSWRQTRRHDKARS